VDAWSVVGQPEGHRIDEARQYNDDHRIKPRPVVAVKREKTIPARWRGIRNLPEKAEYRPTSNIDPGRTDTGFRRKATQPANPRGRTAR
jgi:hypothetical protein